jgi:glycosyltransferase involved in cell wall biosynthesis
VERQAAAHGLGDRLRFVGLQSNVPLWMQAADVLVHASFDEPTGTVIVEGMALGKPVVASRSAGPMEFVEDGACGLLAAQGDAGELAERIGALLADPALRARLGRAARGRARLFSTDRLADDLADAMGGLAHARAGLQPA